MSNPKDISLEAAPFPARLAAAFARGLERADALRPQWSSARSGRVYQPGIGPHTEPATVRLVMQEVVEADPEQKWQYELGVPYPRNPRQKCDIAVVDGPKSWFIEVKMARFKGDNGKPADETLVHLLSPYEEDRSALTDCLKLSRAGFPGRQAVLIYGFDYDDRRLDPAINAFEALAGLQVNLGDRHSAAFADLVHRVHQRGRVFAWEISAERT